MFLNVKALYKSKMARARLPPLPGDYLVDLPSNLDSAPDSLKSMCFGEGDPTPCMPCSFEELLETVQRVPQRSSNAALKGNSKGFVGDSAFMGPQMMTQMLQGMAMAAWAMGAQGGRSEVPLTDLRPPAKSLLDLIDRPGGAPASSSTMPAEVRVPVTAVSVAPLALCNAPANAAESQQETQTSTPPVIAEKLATDEKITEPVQNVLHAEPVAETEMKKQVLQEPVATKKMSLKASLGLMNEARTGAAESEKPAALEVEVQEAVVKKRPAAAPQGGVTKRPASKPKQAFKRPAIEGEDRVARKRRLLLEAGVPRSLMQQYSAGCSTCRSAPFCTPSCWAKRGYRLG